MSTFFNFFTMLSSYGCSFLLLFWFYLFAIVFCCCLLLLSFAVVFCCCALFMELSFFLIFLVLSNTTLFILSLLSFFLLEPSFCCRLQLLHLPSGLHSSFSNSFILLRSCTYCCTHSPVLYFLCFHLFFALFFCCCCCCCGVFRLILIIFGFFFHSSTLFHWLLC